MRQAVSAVRGEVHLEGEVQEERSNRTGRRRRTRLVAPSGASSFS